MSALIMRHFHDLDLVQNFEQPFIVHVGTSKVDDYRLLDSTSRECAYICCDKEIPSRGSAIRIKER